MGQPADALAVFFIGHRVGFHEVHIRLALEEVFDIRPWLDRQRAAAEQHYAAGLRLVLQGQFHHVQRGLHQRKITPCPVDALVAEQDPRHRAQPFELRDIGFAVDVQDEAGMLAGEFGNQPFQQPGVVVREDEVGDFHVLSRTSVVSGLSMVHWFM